MTNLEFVEKLINIANGSKTLYVMGCFGAPLNAKNKQRYTTNCDYNKRSDRTAMINAATDDTFGFDCVCLLKGVWWGFNSDPTKPYGGAEYASNGVPDMSIQTLYNKYCYEQSTDFSHLEVGEIVFIKDFGHVGAYIGNGLVVECTPAWKNCVQITSINTNPYYPTRKWDMHAKTKIMTYVSSTDNVPVQPTVTPNKVQDDAFVWNKLMSVINNAYGVAGLMGNLYAESCIRSNNLQNSYEKSLNFTDDSYTASVDQDKYSNFVYDSAGYGLAQWTYWSRKQNLLNFAKQAGKSIGDLEMQVDFLIKELSTSYGSVMNVLKTATSVSQASDAVLTQYEKPQNQSQSAKDTRTNYGLKYYNTYAGKDSSNDEAKDIIEQINVLLNKLLTLI